MRLNEGSKRELRANIEAQLQQVPDGQRVHLDKELLEDLIFFSGRNKAGTVIKVPIWTGSFLRKIDLSEVSFDNVCFINDGYSLEREINVIMDAEPASRFVINKHSTKVAPFVIKYDDLGDRSPYIIDFSGTNINIDFSRIYGDRIECTDFSGVDLSKSNYQYLMSIDDCNFSNTKISMDFNFDGKVVITSTDFSFNDFSQTTIDSDLIMYYPSESGFADAIFGGYCNFSNTGLKVRYKRLNQHNADHSSYFNKMLSDGLLEHCFIDDKEVLSPIERRAQAQAIVDEKVQEYEVYKQELFSSVESSIAEQIGRMRR